MEFFGRPARQGEIRQLKMSFTYQIDNFREMKAFVAFGQRFKADFVIFERLQNLGPTVGTSSDRRRVSSFRTSSCTMSSRSDFGDPIFGKATVWHDFEWEGVCGPERTGRIGANEHQGRMTQFVGADGI